MNFKRFFMLVAAASLFGYVLRHEGPSLVRYAKMTRM